jgi:hypothetical protein
VSDPGRSTHYFPPVNIIHIEHMQQSQIQQGTIGSLQTQTLPIVDAVILKALVHEIRSADLSLSSTDRETLESDLETVDAQLKRPKSKHGIIRESPPARLPRRSSAHLYASNAWISTTPTRSSPSVVAAGNASSFRFSISRCPHLHHEAGSGSRRTVTGRDAIASPRCSIMPLAWTPEPDGLHRRIPAQPRSSRCVRPGVAAR